MRLAVLLLTLQLIPASALAQTIVDFETIPGGGIPTPLDEIGNAYGSLGVDFGQSLESDDTGTAAFNEVNTPAGFGISAWDGRRGPGGEVGFHVLATFSQPVSSVSAYVFGPSATEFTVIMTAYDFSGAILAAIETEAAFGILKGNLSLAGLGAIHSVSWMSNQPFLAGVGIDELTFTFVPEPGTGGLVALGLAAIGTARRRR